jgi:hypothetical protein
MAGESIFAAPLSERLNQRPPDPSGVRRRRHVVSSWGFGATNGRPLS